MDPLLITDTEEVTGSIPVSPTRKSTLPALVGLLIIRS